MGVYVDSAAQAQVRGLVGECFVRTVTSHLTSQMPEFIFCSHTLVDTPVVSSAASSVPPTRRVLVTNTLDPDR
jgi:hypothetical protein